MSAAGSHYFDEQPTATSSPSTVELWLPDGHLVLQTDRGVFANGTVDSGTKLLLQRGPELHGTTFLDLGCGTGAIALTMARRRPSGVAWAVDVNARARQLTAANAAANGLTNVRIAAPDDVPADVRFDAIWSNPPIRVGKAALHQMLRTWLDRLAPDGSAALVVHKHLGADSLQRWLGEQGWPTERMISSSGYRILTAHAA